MLEADPDIASVFAGLLRERGHTVLCGGALGRSPRSGVDCVVTELFLPHGYERAGALQWMARLRVLFPGTPLVLFSAYPEVPRDAPLLGADATIPKPCDIDDFTRVVEGLIALKAA